MAIRPVSRERNCIEPMKATDSIVLLRSLAEAYETACRPICHKMKLSQTAFDILMFLAANPGYNTAKDICRMRGVRPNMVSFNVERLVEEGYLVRQTVPGDRRKIRLLCTKKAQEIVEEGRQTASRFYDTILEGMTEEEIARFEQDITLICRNAEKLKNG